MADFKIELVACWSKDGSHEVLELAASNDSGALSDSNDDDDDDV